MNDLKVYNLSIYFRNEFLKYDKRIYSPTTVKNSKWWQYFEETIKKFEDREEWNPEVFVKCQFESFGKIYPPQLTTERAWKTFLEYKFRFENIDKEKEIIQNVLTGYKLVKDYCNKYKVPFSVETFLNDNYTKIQLEKKAYPLHFFVFSKSYISVYGNNITKRMIVAQNKKLIEKLKEVLKDDYY